ncbi:MAG TPA: nucleotide exchange factor GrpE [Candidatus Thermoplasmatota archaeon]|nr:nucleotide exchange factor GrpE [Candidatus Thermoplasmatota archaeon]
MNEEARPPHPPDEGPEGSLEDVRAEAHQEPDGLAKALARAQAAEAALAEARSAGEARERELTERLARLQADFENFRRRSREESASAAGRGKEGVLRALLPVLDNLDRALAHANDEGLKLLARQLHETLRAQGVQVIDPSGEAFDAKLHEAVSQESRDGAKAGTVLAVAEKGYALEGRVLRPARVVVAA